MNTITKRIALFALGAILLTTMFTVDAAYARNRDAGAKARGEIGVGFDNSRPTRYSTRSFTPQASRVVTSSPVQASAKATTPTSPSPTVETPNAATSPISIVGNDTAPAVEPPQGLVRTNRAVVKRNDSGPTKKRHNHLYRKQHPGRGFWN